MDTLESLLAGIPDDPLAAFIAADYLEDQGDARAELLRLVFTLTRKVRLPKRAELETRLRELLYERGLRPVVPTFNLALSKRVSLRMVWVPPGTFRMGSPQREKGSESGEHPVHPVTLTRGFWMGMYPVTQAEWKAIRRSNPSAYRNDSHPVDNISWDMARDFCIKVSEKTGHTVRLPTEAEWEYACRAGTTTRYHFGKDITAEFASYEGTLGADQTTPVGSYPPNAFGLYDMHGNVFEWVQDRWSGEYDPGPVVDPTGREGEEDDPRVLRGGSWHYEPEAARSAFRIECSADYGYIDQGLRVVCER